MHSFLIMPSQLCSYWLLLSVITEWILKFTSYSHTTTTLQDGATALLIASENGYKKVVKLLLQSGAKDLPRNVSVHYVQSVLQILYLYVAISDLRFRHI